MHTVTWFKQEWSHAQYLLSEAYAKAYDKHRKTWDIAQHADDPDFQKELREEREGLRLLRDYWRMFQDPANPVLPTAEEMRLMVIGSESR